MKIAYQGEPGAYSEQAIFEFFGKVETQPCQSFDAAFEAVQSQTCESALIPIENSLTGSILQNYELLLRHELSIVGESFLRVRHCLIAFEGVPISGIKRAISHPQALAQCARYLRSHSIQAEEVFDTAGGVRLLRKSGARETAAIASRRAAELYGMQILEEGIEDDPENYTRFLAIAREAILPKALAKTSLVFNLKNEPGALSGALSVFALSKIDLIKIEPRPLKGRRWEYTYFLDFIGSPSDEMIVRALDRLSEYASMVRVLGSYPRFKG